MAKPMSANHKEDLLNFSFYADYMSHKKARYVAQDENEGLALVANGAAESFSFNSYTEREDDASFSDLSSVAYSSEVDTSIILKQIVENSPDLIFSVNVDFELTSANHSCLKAFKKVFGIDLAVGSSILDQLSGFEDDRVELHKILSRSLHEDNLSVDMSLSRTNSISPLYSAQFNKMTNASGVVIGASCIFRDINDKALRTDRLETLSRLDPVTRTLNNREFRVLIDQKIAEHRRGETKESILLYVGVQGLSRIRSECGYNALDRCLLKISMRLRRELTKKDLLARVADYDFGILLNKTIESKYLELATFIHEAVEGTRFKWKGRNYPLNSTIGITKVNGKTLDAISALESADLACEIANDAESPLFFNRHS